MTTRMFRSYLLFYAEYMAYASILTTPEHHQAQIERKFCFYFIHLTLSISVLMERHLLLTDINQKIITTIAIEDLANALLYSENVDFLYSYL